MAHDHPLGPLVRKLERWNRLDEDDRQALLALPHSERSFDRGAYIVREHDRPNHSCLLVSGFAYRQKIVAAGGRQILALHIAGDVVDLQNSVLGVADHSVQAMTSAEFAMIPVKAIQDIAFARPNVGLALWIDTLVDGSVHREWIANIGRRNARERLSHLLCEFGMRLEYANLGQRAHYELPMTQEELADAVGLTPVHVNRTLQSLDRDGLTSRTRRTVVIHDWQKLAELSDFSAEYLHLRDTPQG